MINGMKRLVKKLYYSAGAWLYPLMGKRPGKLGYVPYKFAAIRSAFAVKESLNCYKKFLEKELNNAMGGIL